MEHGPRFAENAARGTLLGLVGASVFFATYSLSARGRRWRRSLALAGALCMAATLGLSWTRLSFAGTALLAVGALALVALALATADCGNATAPTPTNDRAHEKRDLALRMAIAGAVVLTVALASSSLGSQVSGMLTTVPIVSAIMVASTHRSAGSDSARGLMRGSIAGLWGGAAFFTAVGVLISSAAPGVTYLVALLAAAVVSAASMKAGSLGVKHRAAERLAVWR